MMKVLFISWYWFGKNVIIFGLDMSWSVHNDNEKIYILILGKSPQYFLDGATLTA